MCSRSGDAEEVGRDEDGEVGSGVWGEAMTKLTRLKINRFRNVEPMELRFSGGLNVLLGINGSGKTTFLELIAAILSQDILRFREEIFAIEYELSVAGGSLQVLIENQVPHRDNTDDSSPRLVSRRSKSDYSLRVYAKVDVSAFPLIYFVDINRVSTLVTSKNRKGDEGPQLTIDSPYGFDLNYVEWALQAIGNAGSQNIDFHNQSFQSLNQQFTTSRFDESLQFLEIMLRDDVELDSELMSAHSDESLPPFHLTFDADAALSPTLALALSEIVDASAAGWRGSETITLKRLKLPFLQDMVRFAQFKDARLELRLVEKKAIANEQIEFTQFRFGLLKFWFEKLDGSIIPDQKLSYGQKRLLAFLYYLDCNPHIIVADELAAGLHHAWISACIEAIGDRQAFLASHDPILIDELELSSIEDVERSFILCRCDTSSGKERLHWSNMSRYDAERFYEAYNVGLQHVSEILRTKGLW